MQARELNHGQVVVPHRRPTPKDELQENLQPHETIAQRLRRKVLPSLMEQTGARAQGVWIPSWFLAIILIPICGGILWMVVTLTSIQEKQANLQNTLEYRTKELETQTKLNDERWRSTESQLAAIRAVRDLQTQRR